MRLFHFLVWLLVTEKCAFVKFNELYFWIGHFPVFMLYFNLKIYFKKEREREWNTPFQKNKYWESSY